MDKKLVAVLILAAFFAGALVSFGLLKESTLTARNEEGMGETTEFICDRLFTISGFATPIVEVNETGRLVYFTYQTNSPFTTLIFWVDGKAGFNFQIKWEFEAAGRRENTPMAQILRYDTENNVYVAQIWIPLQFRENLTIGAYVSKGETAQIEIWELVLVTVG